MNTIKHWMVAVVVVALGGCQSEPPPPPEVPASAVVLSFSASPAQVEEGGTATLSWQVKDATAVSISTLGGVPVALADPSQQQGSVQVKIDAATVFVLTARGEGGTDSAASSVMVQQKEPSLLCTAIPQEVSAGDPVTLVWNAPSATQITITDASGNEVYSGADVEGSKSLNAAFSTTYTCTAGALTGAVDVHVAPAVLGFAANARNVATQGEVTLSWNVGGAEQVTLSSPGRGDLVTATEPGAIADGTFVDTVPTELGRNGVVTYVLTATAGAMTITRELEVYVGAEPLVVDFYVPPFAKEGGSFSVAWETEQADRIELLVEGVIVYASLTADEAATGAMNLPSPTEEVTVEMRATNGRGGVAVQNAKVAPVGLPTLNGFTASPGVVAQGGDPITLSWDVPNARHVRITNQNGRVLHDAVGALDQGSKIVYANVDDVFTLYADNTVGDSVSPATAAVSVTTPSKLLFDVEPVPAGTPIQVMGHNVPNGGAIVGLPSFQKNEPGTAFIDIAATGVDANYAGPDTTGILINLPQTFSTTVYGVPISATQVSVGNNGWLKFSSTAYHGYDTPSPFPTTALEPLAIAPLWTDLYDVNGEIFWQLDDLGTEQRLIVQWDNWLYEPVAGSSITVQAQIYSSGRIVFAYKTLQGFTNPVFSIGVINADETGALSVPGVPAEGDTFTLFGASSPPIPVIASSTPFTVQVMIGTSGDFLEVTSGPQIIPAAQFGISEVNHNPVTGKYEWIELKNNSSQSWNLAGWTLDFGGGNVLTLDPAVGNVVLPANGFLLLGQDADAAEASAGGPAVDYVYGTAFSLPDASGDLLLVRHGGVYSRHSWTSAGTAGTATQIDLGDGLKFAAGLTSLACPATLPYGSGAQKGTPGAPNGACFKYALSQLPTSGYQSILATGANVGTLTSTSDESTSSVVLPRPVKIHGQTYNTLYVSSNGFISTSSLSSAYLTNKKVPSNTAPVGVIAPYWDDLHGNGGTGSKIAWQQFDPDAVPLSGDEYTIISFENWKRWSYTSSLNFQVKFLEASGDFEFHYGAMTGGAIATGSEATSWYENSAGTAALVINADTAGGIQPFTSYRFTALP